MTIYRGVNGVNREIKQQFRGIGGVNREIKEQYRGAGGINRQVFKKGIGGLDDNTLLMLHAEDFTDSSPYNNSNIITNGGAGIKDGKFQQSVGTADNTQKTKQYVKATLENPLPQVFTIDFWYRIASWNSYNGGDLIYLESTEEYSYDFSTHDLQLRWSKSEEYPNGVMRLHDDYKINWSDFVFYNPSVETWNHMAIISTGSELKAYINGTLQMSKPYTRQVNTKNICLLNSSFGDDHAWADWHARIDEFRVSNVVRWAGDFIPPTEPYSS